MSVRMARAVDRRKVFPKVLMRYDRPRDGRKRHTRIMAKRNDHPSAALPQFKTPILSYMGRPVKVLSSY